MRIRPYESRDRSDVYDVCVRTADGGDDATGNYSTDDLMPDLFAGPYITLEPEHAFVLDDGSRVVGYVIGTTDTPRFVERYRTEWAPSLGDKYARPAPDATDRESALLRLHFGPEHMLVRELADYPAHLHIDLLPSAQRQGWGRRLIDTFLDALHEKNVPAVRLGMLTSNTAGRAFYDRLGFTEFLVPDAVDVTYLVRSTAR